MDFSPAPLFEAVAGAPAGGKAHWLETSDAKRIRVAHWVPEDSANGTVLMFPGRTEYIEKYGNAAGEFTKRHFAFLAIDWRGQGLADRLLDDPRIGQVAKFPAKGQQRRTATHTASAHENKKFRRHWDD